MATLTGIQMSSADGIMGVWSTLQCGQSALSEQNRVYPQAYGSEGEADIWVGVRPLAAACN